MSMESPIDVRVWKYMFHTCAAVGSAALFWSLYREKRDKGSLLDEQYTSLRSIRCPKKGEGLGEEESDKVIQALENIHTRLAQERDDGVSILTVRKNLGLVVKRLEFVKNSENKVCFAALRLAATVCSNKEGRSAFYNADGYRAVLMCLAAAHQNGQVKLMEEAAKTLDQITTVEEGEIIHATDIPEGCEGNAQLAGINATSRMLRTLEPNARPEYLIHVTSTFANITSIRVGSKAIQEGTELDKNDKTKKPGVYYFLQLLAHRSVTINEHAARAVANVLNHGQGKNHTCLVEGDDEYIANLALLLRKSTTCARHALRIIYIMSISPLSQLFFKKLHEQQGISNIFKIWISKNGEHDRLTRLRAESLVHELEKNPHVAPRVKEYLEIYRTDIQQRIQEDEAERQKAMNDQRQQQMMMRQMMMRQAMEGGMDPEQMAAMMGGGM